MSQLWTALSLTPQELVFSLWATCTTPRPAAGPDLVPAMLWVDHLTLLAAHPMVSFSQVPPG